MPLSGIYHYGLVVVLTTNQSPLYGEFSVNRCVRAYRESRLPRTHVRSKTPKFSFIGVMPASHWG